MPPCEHHGYFSCVHLNGFSPLHPPKNQNLSFEADSIRTDSFGLDLVSSIFSTRSEDDCLGFMASF